MNRLEPDLPQGSQPMSNDPQDPTYRSADDNPYAPPQAPIGEVESAEVSSDMAEAEAIRRTYLSHEASIKSIGSLHYLGVVFGIVGLGMFVFSALPRNGEMAGGINSAPFIGAVVYLLVIVSLNLVLGIGLTALKPWARWTEVVLTSILLLIYLLLGTVGVVVVAKGRSVGPGEIGGMLVMSLLLSYILFLLLSKKGSMVFSHEYRSIIERTPHIKYKTSWILKGCLIVLVLVIGLSLIAAFISSRR
jgi:hypothetical protein